MLEYSLNGGSSWQDAGSLMDVNGYKGTIDVGGGNPIEGRAAFVGSSHGYISTRLNLASLAGKSVTFRWRMGLDWIGSGSFFESPSGWWLDDVKLYTCGALPGTVRKTFTATVDDGWVLESAETSNVGGTMNATQTTFNVGDAASDRQYRSIISFNTASLPDNAVITSVTFKVLRQGVTGTNPFTTHGRLMMDIVKGAFGGSRALQLADFQAAASRSGILIPNTPAAGWYSRNLPAGVWTYINKVGVTQFRLRFALDDNDDLAADFIRFYSGNAPLANRPRLIIQYYIP